MKKMKNKAEMYVYSLFVLTGYLLISCNNNVLEISPSKTENKDIAMEMYTHSTTIDRIEYLQTRLHPEYLHPEIIARLIIDPFLKQKLNDPSYESNDTIFSYDEIPMVRESRSFTCISKDGSLQSTTEHLTPFETNIIFQLSNNPPLEDNRICKTVVKDGRVKIYNQLGQLMVDNLYPAVNMSEFLDTMEVYVQLIIKNATDKTKDKFQMIPRLEQQFSKSSCFSRLSNGNVMLECMLDKLPNKINLRTGVSDILRSRTELNEDMTKTLKFELFQGDYLIQRKTYSYNGNTILCNFYFDDLVSENPATIESETLVLNSKGFPVLHHIKEYFQRNQTYYYFNK